MSCIAYIKSCETMPEVPDESVQLIVTTPPEDILFVTHLPIFLREVKRVLKPGGFLVWNVGKPMADKDRTYSHFEEVMYGILCVQRILQWSELEPVWMAIGAYRPYGLGKVPLDIRSHNPLRHLANCYEWWQYYAKGDYHFRMIAADVVEYPPNHFTNERALEWAIGLTTDVGDLVLDPFAGTGTAGKVANSMSRNATLYEFDEDRIPDILKKIPHAIVVK